MALAHTDAKMYQARLGPALFISALHHLFDGVPGSISLVRTEAPNARLAWMSQAAKMYWTDYRAGSVDPSIAPIWMARIVEAIGGHVPERIRDGIALDRRRSGKHVLRHTRGTEKLPARRSERLTRLRPADCRTLLTVHAESRSTSHSSKLNWHRSILRQDSTTPTWTAASWKTWRRANPPSHRFRLALRTSRPGRCTGRSADWARSSAPT